MFLLQKVVSRLIFPLPLALIVGVVGILLLALTKRHRTGLSLVIGALAFLWVAATAPVADRLLWSLEGQYLPVSGIPEEVEAIVVLGSGHVEREEFPPTVSLGRSSSARVVESVRLASGNDLAVVFSGYAGSGDMPNAEMNREAAVELGLDRDRTLVLPEPRNTSEEARAIAAALPDTPVLLVTSASHMPRALLVFDRSGVDTVPAPTEFRAAQRNYSLWSLLPAAEALANTERAWYEFLGILWARLTHR